MFLCECNNSSSEMFSRRSGNVQVNAVLKRSQGNAPTRIMRHGADQFC